MKWSLAIAAVFAGQSVVSAFPFFHMESKRAVTSDVLNRLSLYEQYSAAAYCSNNNDPASSTTVTCSSNNCNSVQSAGAYTITEFENQGGADATGFVAIDKTNKNIVVSYRGSRSFANWLGNLDVKQDAWNICSNCYVHGGFLSSWKATQSKIEQAVASARSQFPSYTVVVTGHSLGGAIATLAASYLRTKGYPVALYTYGSPMVGNTEYATFVTNQSGGNFRVTHQADAVPKLPGYWTGYRHVSPQYWITSGNGKSVTANDVSVSSGIRDTAGNYGAFGVSITNHLWYFNSIAACTPDLIELYRLDAEGKTDMS